MTLQFVKDAKTQAKALRHALAAQGKAISHAQALELVAHQNGAKDWNTLQARLSLAEPQPFKLHDEVRGHYLGQPFVGRIVAIAKLGQNTQVSLQLNEPVDTVQFESFSNMRRHIRGVIGPDGRSPSKTSDGTPHLVISPQGK
ncbi:glyoxalase superfamily protein [Pseudorhodobacter wandonensis]|uniref:glyoxalase superfamily protein n=1 Tax=Pseudorhodobacter wandonensis TaxID=1120568 RepID=UPI00067DE8DD|nr:glyoxalase superfamily protein [Pseudorhodobacter wandonensis]